MTPRVPEQPARAAAVGVVLACAAMLVGLAAGAVWAPPASAHALLSSSVPAADASVASSPAQILLTFTEPPDPALSIVKVVDSTGRPAPGVGAATAVPSHPTQLSVPVRRPLPKGVYTVNWRSVSTTDGHLADGAFAFGVGTVPGPGSVVKVSLLNSSPWISAASAAGRWLLYIGLALLVGGASTTLFVLGARLPGGGLWLLRVAVAVAALGVAAMIGAERVAVGVRSLLPLFVTHEGILLLALGGGVVACGLAVAAVDLWPGRWSLVAVGTAAVATVLMHVLAGHANAPAALRPLNVLEQWIHMTAIGVWIGGLAWLLLGIRGQGRAERAAAVRAFSRIATFTLVVVLVTGLLRSLTEVSPLSGVFHTTYGLTLLIKVGLVAVLVLFGAFNHYRLVPALEDDAPRESDDAPGGDRSARRFGLSSRAELVLATGVLIATAVLSGLAPANSAVAGGTSSPGGQTVVSGSDYATTVRTTLRVTPGTVGANQFSVAVDDYNTGKPLTTVTSVSLGFSLPTQPSVNASTLTLRRASGGTWRGSGLELSIVGTWSVTVLVQEPAGGVDVPLTLRVAR